MDLLAKTLQDLRARVKALEEFLRHNPASATAGARFGRPRGRGRVVADAEMAPEPEATLPSLEP